MQLATYLRVSSDSQLDGFGLDMQRAAVERWADATDHEIVSECIDAGVSGTLQVVDRPGLACALEAISGGDADGLVVARLDRLARELTVQEAILAALWRNGAEVYTADAGLVLRDDPDDPMRTAMRQMAGVFAQLDRALIVKRLRDGRRAKKAAGGHPSGRYPFGHGKEGPAPREQRVLDQIRELRREGWAWDEIAADLNARGLAYAPRTAERWSPRNVAKVAS
jgi:DNA invertase Pin-like site-specific DNA recombinase